MNTSQFAQALQELGNRYVNAYISNAERYSEFVAGIYEPSASKTDTADQQQQRYTEYVRNEGPRVLQQLAEAGLNYYTLVLNTGITATNRFYEQVLKQDAVQPPVKLQEKPRSALLFRGKPGELPSNAFVVSNHKNEPIEVKFDIVEIVSEDGKSRLQPNAKFTPSTSQLVPNSEQIVQCFIELSDEYRPEVVYRGQIHVEGSPNMAIDIAIQVDAATETTTAVKAKPARKKAKPVRKKTSVKRSVKKTRAKTTTRNSKA